MILPLCNIDKLNKESSIDLMAALRVMQMKEKNQQCLPSTKPDLKKRESIINYMIEITDQFVLNLSTYFVAISYYDRISYLFAQDIKTLGKVGVTCLLVAAKYEEMEANTPSFSFFCEQSFSLFKDIDEISMYERDVIQALRWKLGYVTVGHYIDLLKPISVLYKGDMYANQPVTDVALKYVSDYLNFFLSLSISCYPFSLHSASIQTTAIIIAARKAAKIVPFWRYEIEQLMNVPFDDAYSCFDELWKLFKEKYPETQKEQIKESPTNVTAEM